MKSGAVDGKLGIGRRRRAGRAEGVFRWSFRSDFTNKMEKDYQTDRVGSNGHRALYFLKLPSGQFYPFLLNHLISEMTDGTQQQKNGAPCRFGRELLRPLPGGCRDFGGPCPL